MDNEPKQSAPSGLDRALQRRILEALAKLYPEGAYKLATAVGEPAVEDRALLINAQYLAGHELIESGYGRRGTIGDNTFVALREHVITHKGMDFLLDDGGLSAILGVVTVRLHDDTIKALIADRIRSSDLQPEQKNRWLESLRDLPGEATKHIVLKLLDLGLDQAAAAMALIGEYLGD